MRLLQIPDAFPIMKMRYMVTTIHSVNVQNVHISYLCLVVISFFDVLSEVRGKGLSAMNIPYSEIHIDCSLTI